MNDINVLEPIFFYPIEKEWREKTVADFKAATEGVLKAKLK